MKHSEIIRRFWSNVEIGEANECWLWTKGTNGKGYGQFRYGDKRVAAHRMSYALYYGGLNDSLVVRHTCDNKLCCNPRHLVQGTHIDNVQDCIDRNGHRPTRGEDHSNSKLNEESVKAIKQTWKDRPDISQKELANMYEVSESTICNIVKGKIWRHICLDKSNKNG